jgi:septal ring factor EnvC (AmiA/AmiB activator)
MEQKYVYDLHTENVEWLKQAGFYKDELTILGKRIAEVASRNTSKEIQAQIEHFQNQLIVQKNQLDHLQHNIKQQENEVEENIRQNPTAVDRRKIDDHSALRDDVTTFDKLFQSMRSEIMEFLSRTM